MDFFAGEHLFGELVVSGIVLIYVLVHDLPSVNLPPRNKHKDSRNWERVVWWVSSVLSFKSLSWGFRRYVLEFRKRTFGDYFLGSFVLLAWVITPLFYVAILRGVGVFVVRFLTWTHN